MRKLLAVIITSASLLFLGLPTWAETSPTPTRAATAPTEYLSWLQERMRLWPQEVAQLERSPVASSEELTHLRSLMAQVQDEAQAIVAGQELASSPVQLQVLTIETELERLAGEADRLPILAGPTGND